MTRMRPRAWICWGVIVASWIVLAAIMYRSLAVLQDLRAHLGIERPPRPKPLIELIAISSGVAALFLAISLSRRGRAWLGMRPGLPLPSPHGQVYLGAFTLYALLNALGPAILWWVWHWGPLAYLGRFGALLAFLYAFVRCGSIRTPLVDWGWRRGARLWDLSVGLLAGLALAPLGYLRRVFDSAVAAPTTGSTTTLSLLVSVAWAPIVEETLYRGMLYRYLRDRRDWPVAVLTTAAVFGMVHLPLERAPAAFIWGIAFALLREWRGSLYAAIAAHATMNLLIHLVL